MTKPRPASGTLLLWRHGYVLAVSRHGKPHDLGLPGGKVETDETPMAAAVRETREETGLPLARATADVFRGTGAARAPWSGGAILEWDEDHEGYPALLTLRLVYRREGGTPSGREHFVYEGSIRDCPPLAIFQAGRRSADQDLTVVWARPERLIAHTNTFSGFNRGLFAHLGLCEAKGV